jgi:hypothetical protein
MWKRLLSLLGVAEHAQFIWEILDWLGLTKPINWVLYLSASGVGGYLARAEEFPPIAIFLAIIASGVGLAFVYAFLHSRSLKPPRASAAKTETPLSAEIVVNGGKLFEALEQSGVNRARTVRAQIENTGESQILNGKLKIIELDPHQNGNAAFLLKSDIAIGPGQQSFVDVAAYSEGTSQAKPGKWIQLLIPPPGPYLFDVPPGALPPLPHIFKLQFSELDRVLDEVYCRVSVDSGHRLHLERWDNNRDPERLISLHDAAVRFYEAAEENGFLEYECDINAPPEKRLEHIKLLLMVDDRTHLLGVQSPSTKRRPIPKSDLTEDFYPGEDNTIVRQFSDEPVYVDVCLPDADLVRVIYDYVEHYRKLG